MNNLLRAVIKEQILAMPEYRQGVNKVRVKLNNGDEYTDIFVAWGREIVKVGKSTTIPFDASDIVSVVNDL